MKWSPAREIPEAVFERFTILVARGLPREDVIVQMRLTGLNILDCMSLVEKLYRLSRNEAKTAVHFSQAWLDRRESHEALHESACEAAGELATQNETHTEAPV